MIRLTLALSALCACQPPPEVPPPAETDAFVSRVDGVEMGALVACVDDAGAVHAAWGDDRDGHPGVWYNRSLDAGLTWEADRRLDGGAVGASAPDIACSGEGVFVAWEDLRDGQLGRGNIYFNRSRDSGVTWLGADLALDGDPEGEAMSRAPRVAAAAGFVYVAWYDGRNGAFDVLVQASPDGGDVWLDAPSRVDTDWEGEAWSGAPRVAATDGGVVVVAWEELRDGAPSIYANQSSDFGRTFQLADARLDWGGGAAGAHALALADGRALVAWQDADASGVRSVRLARSPDAGFSWESSVQVDAGGADALGPAVAGAAGAVHVAWSDRRSGAYEAWITSSADGGVNWGEALRLEDDIEGEGQALELGLAASEDGLVVAHWQDRRDDEQGVGFSDLWYRYSDDAGATWSESDLRVSGNAPGTSWSEGAWAGRVGEELVFLWIDGRYGSGDVFAMTLSPGEDSGWEPASAE